ncbi:MAG: hypothetical protein Q7S56_03465 [Nanoarchaeota archaeon]|nr:hypothetical protein [Nanoarchaeota archaeon]
MRRVLEQYMNYVTRRFSTPTSERIFYDVVYTEGAETDFRSCEDEERVVSLDKNSIAGKVLSEQYVKQRIRQLIIQDHHRTLGDLAIKFANKIMADLIK